MMWNDVSHIGHGMSGKNIAGCTTVAPDDDVGAGLFLDCDGAEEPSQSYSEPENPSSSSFGSANGGREPRNISNHSCTAVVRSPTAAS